MTTTAASSGRATGVPPTWAVLLPFALGAGLLTSLAFAPVAFAPAAFVGVTVFALAVAQAARLRASVGLGLAFGLALNLATISWQAAVLVASYLGLAALETAFFGLLGGLLYAVRRLPWAPVAAASCWVLVEGLQARYPYGGFPWTRLGYTVIDTPLAGLYPLAGAPSATFAVALVCHAAARALASRTMRRALVAAGTLVAILAVGGLGLLLPGPPADAPTINVGWVQGGASGGGFYGLGPAGDITKRQAAETRAMLDEVAAGTLPKPGFIVWPENGTDADPFLDATTNKILADSVAVAGVPILVTVPTVGDRAGERKTSSIWWTNAGVTARYDKRNLVPFGEWIPLREVLLPLIPMLEVIGDQTIPGTGPGALHVTGPDGRPLIVGTSICYEVAYADTVFDAANAGAEVLTVGSNNAMFQGTPQIEQQFAITRVRAAEVGRQILVVTTSGVSGLIDEHGRVVLRGQDSAPDSGVVTMTRTTHRTPELLGGWVLEYVLAALAVLSVVAALVRGRRAPQWTSGTSPQQRERTDG